MPSITGPLIALAQPRVKTRLFFSIKDLPRLSLARSQAPLGVRRGTGYRLGMTKASARNRPARLSPSLADIESLAREELVRIPQFLRRHAAGVVLRVEEFPDREVEREMKLESPFDLLGLYHGVALNNKSVTDTPGDVDMIFLYRRPLLDYWCETGEDLRALIRNVLVHEIGHHFGFSDEDMERIEAME